MEKAKKAKTAKIAEKKTAKTSKPVKAEKKIEKSPDREAFDKLIASDKYQSAKRSAGSGKLFEIFMAGLRRGKNLKK